jgi:5-methylcytosine-specific restriction enzyme A
MRCREYKHLYNNKRWRRIRNGQIMRQPLCQHCIKRGRVQPATDVDHVIPHKGNEELFWRGELQSLCKECHSRKTAEEQGHGRAEIDVTGAPANW